MAEGPRGGEYTPDMIGKGWSCRNESGWQMSARRKREDGRARGEGSRPTLSLRRGADKGESKARRREDAVIAPTALSARDFAPAPL